ncbi:MAG TPA: endonuclease [Deltaproteobacteria bacterium]|nr:MAG: endonuclease [Deltaproteobacteria bacterium GWA2_55_82]OGQ64853.1 MAG: endonuclease [Deltaproteobacteria bacterium RIFCSPLOWO2_02_FULL_55_12]OIJ73919.1 MAG: endonuclease [Deltaproteobacteria bacterium GWC2_55_46]HBG46510.1 endonuclease [Deltaproteobacteria bacterium]HCY09912.1 endonuclease [Deltaproteobacteria bacterium]
MRRKDLPTILTRYYDSLFTAFGPQGWWPGQTRFEVIIGAILTQNTNWTNVEKAIRNLRDKKCLTPEKLMGMKHDELASLIRPAGYFNIKAKRLRSFLDHLFTRHKGSLDRLLKQETQKLRSELLSINGIGPETADSILLYAGGHPEFVVDAYTKRMLSRHGLIKSDAGYDEVKALFMESLPRDIRLFNEYHALIVKTGKDFCRPKEPRCKECPLGMHLP